MATVPTFEEANLRAVCDVLGDTSSGLTGSDIAQLLRQCRIDDPVPNWTKRLRLFEALNARQAQDGCANAVAAFIEAAMNPVRYASSPAGYYNRLREDTNRALAFSGLHVAENGRLSWVEAARTLDQAAQRASHLRSELERRRVHPEVLRFCRAELVESDYFHAVLEATKSVADRLRGMCGRSEDGAALVDAAFGRGTGRDPLLATNTLRTQSEVDEHNGFMSLLKGMFQMYRNPTAHDPRIARHVSEDVALDLLSLVSLLHRRLDSAVPTRPAPP